MVLAPLNFFSNARVAAARAVAIGLHFSRPLRPAWQPLGAHAQDRVALRVKGQETIFLSPAWQIVLTQPLDLIYIRDPVYSDI